MGRRKKKKNSVAATLMPIGLILFGILFSIIIYSKDMGVVGNFIKNQFLGGLIGNMNLVIPIILIVLGIYTFFRDFSRLKLKAFQVVILVISISGIMSLIDKPAIVTENVKSFWDYVSAFYQTGTQGIGGGLLGGMVSIPIAQSLNDIAAYVILGAVVLAFSIFVTGVTISPIIVALTNWFKEMMIETKEDYIEKEQKRQQEIAARPKRNNKGKFKEIMEQTDIIESAEQLNFDFDEEEPEELEDEVEDEEEYEEVEEEMQEDEEVAEKEKSLYKKRKKIDKEDDEPEELDLEHNAIEEIEEEYEFPPVELLNEAKPVGKEMSNRELKEIAIKLQKTLASFGVDAKVTNVTRGPTVTRYELQPSVGVKVSKILNLADDIALNLAAKSIRIEAPIPGKSAVGIEVPNKITEMVTLREIIESEEFEEHPSKVSFALGKAIDGTPAIADIAKMPHVLIAGSTGSGKSVCINSIIMSLIYKSHPSEVKLILVDPKVVELGVYNGIPHLLIPVVTDPKKAAGALNWAVQEMVNRYNLFASKGVRDIKGYNQLLESEGEEGVLPQIVIIIDELADLMMVSPDEVEDAICRLAQMARAAGMHLVIATQRPSVDVITGIIKANIPSRIAFTVSSQVDSRTILDMAGAEKLLGKGDMLFYPIGESKPVRVQGSFVSDKEIEEVIDYIKQNNAGHYSEDIIEKIEKSNAPQAEEGDDCDPLLSDAIDLAVNMGQTSASMIQRRFKVGYARAGRIIDQMEARGLITGYDGSKPRTTLITKEDWEAMKMSADN